MSESDTQWLDNLLIQMLPDMDDKYTPITRKEAKQAILTHIAEQVRLGKVDELVRLRNDKSVAATNGHRLETSEIRITINQRLSHLRAKKLSNGKSLTESVE